MKLIRKQQQQQKQEQQQQFRSSSGSQNCFDQSFALLRQFSSLTRQSSSTPSSSKKSTWNLNPFGPDSRFAGSSLSCALGGCLGKPPTPPSDGDDSTLETIRLQNEFDKEDRALFAQRTELAESTQQLFECGICMEEVPYDSITCPDPCGHPFCRECLRGHVTARLDEHRFPILCPTCTAGKGKGEGTAGEVSQSVVLNCRKCQRTMFVARDDHEEAKTITCPLPDCKHEWCKQCQQSIDDNGPKHSCDGTSELDHLMKQQGRKYCPTCKAPIQRISGCNHMLCMTPACNTHFSYICGGVIVDSALRKQINEVKAAHYKKMNCTIFDESPE